MAKLQNLLLILVAFIGIYFFSFQLQVLFSKVMKFFNSKVGHFAVNQQHSTERYVYLHPRSIIAKIYSWVNQQLVATGLKRVGVTPVGYLIFWGFTSLITTWVLAFILGISFSSCVLLYFVVFVVYLIATRVAVSKRIEKREAELMDALDLIIPEINCGVKNVIERYTKNFAPSIQPEFLAFTSSVNSRGVDFEDAMATLTDNLGVIFRDFAEKAVIFEKQGDLTMTEIFVDITETNRLRRDERYRNQKTFSDARTYFLTSTGAVLLYLAYILATDAFSRRFFTETKLGMFLLLVFALIIFGVLSYIATIKSRNI